MERFHFVCFPRQIFSCSPECPRICSVDQTDIEPKDSPAYAFLVLELKAYDTTTWQWRYFLKRAGEELYNFQNQ